MSKNPRKPKTCPTCHRIEAVRKFLYGFPIYPVDKNKYVLGGCVVQEDAPRYLCIDCDALIHNPSHEFKTRINGVIFANEDLE